MPVEGFDAAMATLVRSVMLGMKHAAPIMMKQGSGSIINNGSVGGRRAGYSTSMIYGAAKAAVNHLTVCAAMQLGEKNVRCNSISPGGIATGIFAKALGLAPDKADSYAEAMKARIMAKNQPIPRAGLTDDIAQCRGVPGVGRIRASSTATTWWSMAAWSAAACGRRTRRASRRCARRSGWIEV